MSNRHQSAAVENVKGRGQSEVKSPRLSALARRSWSKSGRHRTGQGTQRRKIGTRWMTTRFSPWRHGKHREMAVTGRDMRMDDGWQARLSRSRARMPWFMQAGRSADRQSGGWLYRPGRCGGCTWLHLVVDGGLASVMWLLTLPGQGCKREDRGGEPPTVVQTARLPRQWREGSHGWRSWVKGGRMARLCDVAPPNCFVV